MQFLFKVCVPRRSCKQLICIMLVFLCSSEVAEIVFNRCIKDNGLHPEDQNYQITLYYEFLEDVYADWSDIGDGTASETSSQASFSMEEIPEDEEFQRIRGKAALDEAIKQLEKKKNHPLMIMVRKHFVMNCFISQNNKRSHRVTS